MADVGGFAPDYAGGFAPHDDLAETLLGLTADVVSGQPDGAHDMAHLMRVWRNAMTILAAEGGDGTVLAAAVLLHDCVAVEKSSPLRSQASRLAAERAGLVLTDLGWDQDAISAVCHAIAAHSFSAGLVPETMEAMILQDADRLDAIGLIGVARCFYTAGRMGSSLYNPVDPRALHRPLDDRAFAIDHFSAKLLRLQDGFQTATGRAMAASRTAAIQGFLDQFEAEIGG